MAVSGAELVVVDTHFVQIGHIQRHIAVDTFFQHHLAVAEAQRRLAVGGQETESHVGLQPAAELVGQPLPVHGHHVLAVGLQ